MTEVIDNHAHVGFDPLFYQQGWSPYCHGLEHLIAEVTGNGIDRVLVFPFITYQALDPVALARKQFQLRDQDNAIPYAFENNRLRTDLERLPADCPIRFEPLLIADPMRRTSDQVNTWRDLPSDYPVRGIKIQGTIIEAKVLSLLHEGSCILDYASEKNLPLLIHSSIRSEDQWSQCRDLLTVASERPDVRFILAHSCRFHKPSLDRVAELPNTWFDCSAHGIHCQLAVLNHPAVAVHNERFQSDFHNPVTVLKDLAQTYPGKLIWGSDTPYHSIQYEHVQLRSSYREEASYLHKLPEDIRTEISYCNTTHWLTGSTL